MDDSEDHIAHAAEYALGTLDIDERTAVEARMAADPDYAALVRAWEFRLGVLNQMVGAVEPQPELWDRIKAAIELREIEPPAVADLPDRVVDLSGAGAEPPPTEPSTEPLRSAEPESGPAAEAEPPIKAVEPDFEPGLEPDLETNLEPQERFEPLPSAAYAPTSSQQPPSSAAPPVAPVEATALVPMVGADNNLVLLSTAVRRWRGLARVASALAAALVALVAMQIFAPNDLPDAIRPAPRTKVVEVKSPETAPPAPSAQYVALLQGQGGQPGFILTVDGATKHFSVRKLGATMPEPNKSYELWLISDKLPRPRSLGVIGSGDFTARPILAAYDTEVINNATYAVTLEQSGGSPDGVPHSAPVYAGRLIETVQPPR